MSTVTFNEKMDFSLLPPVVPLAGKAEVQHKIEVNQDDEWVALVLTGQDHCFEALVRKHYPRVSRIARHFFRSPELVEDILQDTFAKAYFSLHTYRKGASFEHWLARIAVNNCYDELRRKKKRNEVFISDATEEESAWLDHKLAEQADVINATPEDQKIADALTARLLAGLAPEERVILTLLHVQDYSVKEIAQMLDWSEAKVKIRAFRARHSLRRALKRMALTEERLAKQRA
jgi:RNA polymerase sigma-70 factor (ECF subfamily)